MSGLPRIEARSPAPPGTLGGDYCRGVDGAVRLLRRSSGHGAGREIPHNLLGRANETPALHPALGASSPSAREKLSAILHHGGGLVSTGHQPVLFLGPLYVLYKLLSAIEIARRMEAATSRPSLALFWVASDDHDWEEVGGTRIIDTHHELRRLRLPPPPGWANRSVGPAPVPECIRSVIEDMALYVPKSEFRDHYIQLILDTYRPGETLGSAFIEMVAKLLPEWEFAWLDSSAEPVKRASIPLFRRALSEREQTIAAMEAANRSLRTAGYEPSVPTLPGASLVFYDTGHARERVYVEDGWARAGRDGESVRLAELLEQLEAEPERFSPNVALRPVLESWLLPVKATVLGPGEIAYWAQLPELFRFLDARFPDIYPRAAWSLVEARVDKVLRKLGAESEQLADGGESLSRIATTEGRPPEVTAALERLHEDLARGFDDLERSVAKTLPGVRSAVLKARKQALAAAAGVERRLDATVRERQQVFLEQIRRSALHLFPDGHPQERVLSPFYFLFRHGQAWLDALAAATRERTETAWPPGGSPRTGGGLVAEGKDPG
ncbi:MAG: bacillithiol biosynthesis cysteine-adding enzyme BshC [Gemmatimonadota bacterium]